MIRKTFGFIGLFVFLAAGNALALGFSKEFSAQMVTNASGREMHSVFYSAKDKTRMEMGQMVMIIRQDLNVSWMIMPEQGMYMEQPIDPRIAVQASERMPGEVSRKSIGREDVSGVNAEKFEITYTDKEGSKSMYQWMGPEGIPVKMAAVDGSWQVEYQNIQVGAQAPGLFEPPVGFRKMSIPNMGGQ